MKIKIKNKVIIIPNSFIIYFNYYFFYSFITV